MEATDLTNKEIWKTSNGYMQVERVKYIERENFDKYEGVYQNNYRLASQTIAFLLITLKRICCPQPALCTTDPP